MSVGLIDTIGLISGGLGIISFFQDLIPEAPEAAGVAVNVKLGRNDSQNTGGMLYRMDAYNNDNEYITGEELKAEQGSGGLFEITLDQETPGVQTGFLSLAAGDDAICIAWITLENYDGATQGAWTGDIGSSCGQAWQYQGEFANNEEYAPRCTWLDANGDSGPNVSLKFRRGAYGEDVQSTLDNNIACDATIYTGDQNPVDGRPAKRSIKKRSTKLASELIVSPSIKSHSAEDLCNSATSWGNDFIGSDGKYCDMETKTLYPLCSETFVSECVELVGNTIVHKTGVARSRVAVRSSGRTYASIEHW